MKSKILHIKLILLGVLLSQISFAQMDKLQRVQNCIMSKDINCAQQTIDSVFLSKSAITDPQAWYFRAFVYYELAKKDKNKINSILRDSSIAFAKKSNSLNADASQIDANNEILKRHSITYFSLCKKYLEDSLNYKKSNESYTRYKTLFALTDSAFSFKAKDIEYYSAVGATFSELFKENISNKEYAEIGKVSLMKVLDLDPKNVSASFNLGIIYYNQGVNFINSMDVDTPLDQLETIQDNSVKLFKQSLPFMNHVYELDPKNLKALESLRQIYFSLHDDVRANEFNNKLEKAQQGK